MIRPSFTLGGSGGGAAKTLEEFRQIVQERACGVPGHEVLIEESVEGWKEFELEVMRDTADNVIIVCSIENFDAMGVHTGDSITVAPQMTLSDRQYQAMRDEAKAVIRKVGVDTGGSNIQFAVDPKTGRRVVIEMNPRVSRSSALASKATGFPIAKIAALLAVGYHLDEIPNDITKKTPASFEPSLDYVVVKIPRWTFEKFPRADNRLTIQMKSVGEAMAIGRTFPEALGKAIRSLEIGARRPRRRARGAAARGAAGAASRSPRRSGSSTCGGRSSPGMSVDDVASHTRIDPWFLDGVRRMVETEEAFAGPRRRRPCRARSCATPSGWACRTGPSRARWAARRAPSAGAAGSSASCRSTRRSTPAPPSSRRRRPYFYSTYEDENESIRTDRRKVVILGGGPNRIGQGIEFDYCCVHACYALSEAGFETIMINCNPETVSTDYDTSDRLYFEPLTFEDVVGGARQRAARRRPGPVRRPDAAEARAAARGGGLPDLGDLARVDRPRGGPRAASGGCSRSSRSPRRRTPRRGPRPRRSRPPAASAIRSSCGRPTCSVAARWRSSSTRRAWRRTCERPWRARREHPVLIDRFLDDAVELDVDALCDGTTTWIGGVQQHIEEAGIHSGDSFSVLPPWKVPPALLDEIRDATRRLAVGARGARPRQHPVRDPARQALRPRGQSRAPRAPCPSSRRRSAFRWRGPRRCCACRAARLASLELPPERDPVDFFIKAPVFPFRKFPGEDVLLGPEMKSTGEVMGISPRFGDAFAKACEAVGTRLPLSGRAFLTVNPYDKAAVIPIGRELARPGLRALRDRGHARGAAEAGVEAERGLQGQRGQPQRGRPHGGGGDPAGRSTRRSAGESRFDEAAIRAAALRLSIPCLTTLSAATAAVEGIRARQEEATGVAPLQEYHRG